MLEVAGVLSKISTTTDGGWRVTFDFPGDHETGITMAALATMRQENLKLEISSEK